MNIPIIAAIKKYPPNQLENTDAIANIWTIPITIITKNNKAPKIPPIFFIITFFCSVVVIRLVILLMLQVLFVRQR